MIINIVDIQELQDGFYNAEIADVAEIISKNQKEPKCKITLHPYRDGFFYEDAFLWLDKQCSSKSVEVQCLRILGVKGNKIDINILRKKILNQDIGIEIQNNISRDGIIYHNVVSVFQANDEINDDDFDDPSEDTDEFEDDEEFDEDDSDENEDDFDDDEDDSDENSRISENNFDGDDLFEGNIQTSRRGRRAQNSPAITARRGRRRGNQV